MILCEEEIKPILGDMTVSKSHNISMVPLGILPDSRYAPLYFLETKSCPEFPLSTRMLYFGVYGQRILSQQKEISHKTP